MSHYKTHIFICTNQKDAGKRCCGAHANRETIDYARQKAVMLGISKESKCRINSSGCLGRCEEGPVMAVYPQGEWYTYKSNEDIDRILECVSQNKVCADKLI